MEAAEKMKTGRNVWREKKSNEIQFTVHNFRRQVNLDNAVETRSSSHAMGSKAKRVARRRLASESADATSVKIRWYITSEQMHACMFSD